MKLSILKEACKVNSPCKHWVGIFKLKCLETYYVMTRHHDTLRLLTTCELILIPLHNGRVNQDYKTIIVKLPYFQLRVDSSRRFNRIRKETRLEKKVDQEILCGSRQACRLHTKRYRQAHR